MIMQHKRDTARTCCTILTIAINVCLGRFPHLATSTAPVISPPLQTSYTFNPKTQNILQIQCRASGSPTPVISWRRTNSYINTSSLSLNGVTITGGTLSISPASGSVDLAFAKAVSGWYSCVAANRDGSAIADFSLSVLVPPIIIQPPQRTYASYPSQESDTATWMKILVTCKAVGIPSPTISWYEGNTTISSNSPGYNITVTTSGLSVLAFEIPRKAKTLLFKCKASNAAGNTEKSAQSSISRAALPLLSKMQPRSFVTGSPNSTVQLVCNLSPKYTSQRVSWYYNGKRLPSSWASTSGNQAILNVSMVNTKSEGVYGCQTAISIFNQWRNFVLSVPELGDVSIVNQPLAAIKVLSYRRVFLLCSYTLSNTPMSLTWQRSNGQNVTSSPLAGAVVKDLGYMSLLDIPGRTVTLRSSDLFRCIGQQLSGNIMQSQSTVVSVEQLETCRQNVLVNGEANGMSGWTVSVPFSLSTQNGGSVSTDRATGESFFHILQSGGMSGPLPTFTQDIQLVLQTKSSWVFVQCLGRASGLVIGTNPTVNLSQFDSQGVRLDTFVFSGDQHLSGWQWLSTRWTIRSTARILRVELRPSNKVTTSSSTDFDKVCVNINPRDAAPTFTKWPPASVTVEFGSCVTLSCSIVAFPPANASWIFTTPSGVRSVLKTTTSPQRFDLHLCKITTAKIGQYRCTASNIVATVFKTTELTINASAGTGAISFTTTPEVITSKQTDGHPTNERSASRAGTTSHRGTTQSGSLLPSTTAAVSGGAGSSSSNLPIIAGAASGGVLAILVIITIVYLRRRKMTFQIDESKVQYTNTQDGGSNEDYEAMQLNIKPATFDHTSMHTAAPQEDKVDYTPMKPPGDDYLPMAADSKEGNTADEYAYTEHRHPPPPSLKPLKVTVGIVPPRTSSLKKGLQSELPPKPQAPEKPIVPVASSKGALKQRSRLMYMPPSSSDARPLVADGDFYEEYNKEGRGDKPEADLYESYTEERKPTHGGGEEDYEEYVPDSKLQVTPSASKTGKGQAATIQQRATKPAQPAQRQATKQQATKQQFSRQPPHFSQPPPPRQPSSKLRSQTFGETPLAPDRSPKEVTQPKPISLSQVRMDQIPKRTTERPNIGAPPTMPSRTARHKPTERASAPDDQATSSSIDYEDTVPDSEHTGMEKDLHETAEIEYSVANERRLRAVKPRVTSKLALLGYDQLDTS